MEPRRVLIVDQSDEMRHVLKTILECRGWEAIEARASRQGLALASDCRPDVIVLDLETLQDESSAPCGQDVPQWQDAAAPLIFLGTLPRSRGELGGRCLTKPYHYAPLLRTIEELWDRSQHCATRAD